jgi:hypothetical protein
VSLHGVGAYQVFGKRHRDFRNLHLLVSLHGVGGVSGFWEAPSRLLTGRYLPSTLVFYGSPLTVCFVYFCATCSADNPTIRMSLLSLLFVLMFLLLLALESLSLSRIVVLMLNHTPMLYAVVCFLNIEIILCFTKLLLFPTMYDSRVNKMRH